MSGFKLTILFIAAFGVVGFNAQTTGLDAMLFGSFCQRQFTKTAFGICFTAAADKSTGNTLGTDLYSVASSGSVSFNGDSTKKYSFFTIVASGDSVSVTCESTATTAIAEVDLAIQPATLSESPKFLSTGPVSDATTTKYRKSGIFKKGATIVYSSTIPVTCTWSKA